MNKWMIAAAALFVVAAPGVAAAQTGYVGAVYSNLDVDGAVDDVDVYGVEGSVFFQGSGTIGFEVDASVLDSDDSDAGFGLTGHVFTRNDRYLFGAFAGVSDSDDSTTWQVGVEGNKYYDRWTLAGALAYATNDDADADGYGVNVQARFFPTDNFRLQANIGWASVDAGGGDDDGFTYGVGGEYQFAGMPVSIGAAWAHTEFDDAGLEADSIGVTVRYNFGGLTLFDRDRNGASQADISGLGSILGL